MTVQEIQAVIKEKIPSDLVVPEHNKLGHFYRHTPTNILMASVTTKGGILDSPHLKKWAARQAVEHIDKHWHTITSDNKEEVFRAAVMAHEDTLEDAGGVGTEGHKVVDRYLSEWFRTGVKPKEDITAFIEGSDVRLHAITRSAQLFMNDFDVIPIASELFVCSLKHRFAGQLDALLMVKKVLQPGASDCVHNYMSSNRFEWQRRCFNCNEKVEWVLALTDWKTSNQIDKPQYAMQPSAYWEALKEMTGLKPKEILVVKLNKQYAKYDVMRVTHRPSALKAALNLYKVYDWLENGQEKLSPLKSKKIMVL